MGFMMNYNDNMLRIVHVEQKLIIPISCDRSWRTKQRKKWWFPNIKSFYFLPKIKIDLSTILSILTDSSSSPCILIKILTLTSTFYLWHFIKQVMCIRKTTMAVDGAWRGNIKEGEENNRNWYLRLEKSLSRGPLPPLPSTVTHKSDRPIQKPWTIPSLAAKMNEQKIRVILRC